MKKVLSILVLLMFAVSIINMVFGIRDSFFYNINDLPSGEFLYSSLSPSGDRTVKFYKIDSVLGKAVRGELVTVDEQGRAVSKNVYWNIGTQNVVSGWMDDNCISIDGEIIDTSINDYFDCREELKIDNKALDEKLRINNYSFS